MNKLIPPYVYYDAEEDDFFEVNGPRLSREFYKRWISSQKTFPQSASEALALWAPSAHIHTLTTCWNCNKFYHNESSTCQFCDATNANHNPDKAMKESFDKENNLQEIADLLYQIGWRPACDVQYGELRKNLDKLRALLIGPIKPQTLELSVDGKVIGTIILNLPKFKS